MSRMRALLIAHDLQHDAVEDVARKARAAEQLRNFESWRTTATDRAAHRCCGCGAWLYSVRLCSTPGC